MKKKTPNIDIFKVLERSDAEDFNWFRGLNSEELKEFKPWMIQRWLSSKKLQLVNEITNPLISSIPPELAWRLFCSIGIPNTTGYSFPAVSKSSSYKTDQAIKVISDYYQISTKEAATRLDLLAATDIIEMAEALAMEEVDLRRLRNRLKKHA